MGSLIIVILNWACNLTKIKSFYSNLLKNIWEKFDFFLFLIVRAMVKDFGQIPANIHIILGRFSSLLHGMFRSFFDNFSSFSRLIELKFNKNNWRRLPTTKLLHKISREMHFIKNSTSNERKFSNFYLLEERKKWFSICYVEFCCWNNFLHSYLNKKYVEIKYLKKFSFFIPTHFLIL